MPTENELLLISEHDIKPSFRDDGTWDGHTITVARGPLHEALWELVKTGHFDRFRACKYPDCREPGSHGHHLTYEPRVIFPLCEQHHRDVTVINTNAAARTRRKLTNDQRWELWEAWLNGTLMPVYDANALRYLATWKPKYKR